MQGRQYRFLIVVDDKTVGEQLDNLPVVIKLVREACISRAVWLQMFFPSAGDAVAPAAIPAQSLRFWLLSLLNTSA